MDEVGARVALVAGAMVVALLATVALRFRSSGRPRRIDIDGLDRGVYFFSSATCLDCAPARKALLDALGDGGFTEVSWEEDPGVLHDLGISAVPATLLVDEAGRGMLYPGMPDAALRRLGP